MIPPIEGLPPGVRIKNVSLFGPGAPTVSIQGSLSGKDEPDRQGQHAFVVLEPDNVYGVLDLAAVPIPEGYERAGEKPEEWFREVRAPGFGSASDLWLSGPKDYTYPTVLNCQVCLGPDHRRIILRRKTKRSTPKQKALHLLLKIRLLLRDIRREIALEAIAKEMERDAR